MGLLKPRYEMRLMRKVAERVSGGESVAHIETVCGVFISGHDPKHLLRKGSHRIDLGGQDGIVTIHQITGGWMVLELKPKERVTEDGNFGFGKKKGDQVKPETLAGILEHTAGEIRDGRYGQELDHEAVEFAMGDISEAIDEEETE